MAQSLCSWKNLLPSTVGLNEPDQPVSPEGTPATSGIGPSDAPAPDTPLPAPISTNELFKQFMKAYLEAQTPAPVQAEPQEQLLKACFPDFYYGNLHMDCYRFCQ